MTERREGQAVDVLPVEDDPGDVLMTRQASGHDGFFVTVVKLAR